MEFLLQDFAFTNTFWGCFHNFFLSAFKVRYKKLESLENQFKISFSDFILHIDLFDLISNLIKYTNISVDKKLFAIY